MDLYDYHGHNGYYRGSDEVWTAQQGWKVAQEKKISLLGIANKVEYNHPNHDWIPIMRKKIDDYGNPNILLGIELDIGHPTGKTVLKEEYLRYLDYILAGPHNQPSNTLAWSDIDDEILEEYFSSYRDILVNSFKNPKNPIDIWTHPFLQEIELTGAKYMGWLEPIFDEMLEICISKNISLEINENYFRHTHPGKLVKDWWKSDEEYVKDRRKILIILFSKANTYENATFSLGSDTHNLINVGDISESLKFAQNIGIPKSKFKKISKCSK